MAKGFAQPLISSTLILSSLIALSACSQKNAARNPSGKPIVSETIPIENSKLTNCHFKASHPTYSYQSSIEPNPISCDDGVPRKVELLTPTPLPNGIQFSMNQLSLVGTANEKVIGAPYEFYLENEAGYTIIKLQITVK